MIVVCILVDVVNVDDVLAVGGAPVKVDFPSGERSTTPSRYTKRCVNDGCRFVYAMRTGFNRKVRFVRLCIA